MQASSTFVPSLAETSMYSIPFSSAKLTADSSETCLSCSRSFLVPIKSLQQSVISLLIANHFFTFSKVSSLVRSKTNNTPFAPLKYDLTTEENRSCPESAQKDTLHGT